MAKQIVKLADNNLMPSASYGCAEGAGGAREVKGLSFSFCWSRIEGDDYGIE